MKVFGERASEVAVLAMELHRNDILERNSIGTREEYLEAALKLLQDAQEVVEGRFPAAS